MNVTVTFNEVNVAFSVVSMAALYSAKEVKRLRQLTDTCCSSHRKHFPNESSIDCNDQLKVSVTGGLLRCDAMITS